MRLNELDSIMGWPGKAGNYEAGSSSSGGTTQNSFVLNNSSRQIDDESLDYLVEYMELDEFLDECDLKFDTNISETGTELDVDGILSKNVEQLPFEIGQQPTKSCQQFEALEFNKRKNEKLSLISNSNASQQGSITEQMPTSNFTSQNLIKTEFEVDGIGELCQSGEQIFPIQQQIHTPQQQLQTENKLARNTTSQIILPQGTDKITYLEVNHS